MAGTLTIACVQMCSGKRQDNNITAMEMLVGEAAAQGAHYVQTPEMTGILENNGERLIASIGRQEEDKVFAAASALAKQHNIWLHLGSTAIATEEATKDGRAANRSALFDPDGKIVATYDKIHMFDVDVDGDNHWRESQRYVPGKEAVVAQTSFGKLGFSICYDIRFPALYRSLAKAGASILTCPAAFTQPTGKAHWEVLLRARAIENGCFMVAAAQAGDHEDGRKTWGHSMIISPWGEVVGELDHQKTGVLLAEIDLSQVESARNRIPSLENDRAYRVNSDNLRKIPSHHFR